MHQHQGQKISLWQPHQALDIPLVEVWRLAAILAVVISAGEYGGSTRKRRIFGLAIDRDIVARIHLTKRCLFYV